MRGQDGRFRWTYWAVGLSIAFNLFFAGFIGAQAWRHRHPESLLSEVIADGPVGGVVVQAILRQIAEKLPPADGHILRGAFARKFPELVPLWRQSFQAVERVRADIAERPFDGDKTRTDMLAAREARQQVSPLIEGILLDALPRMSDEGRLALSQYRLLPQR
ncbi:periplasmic heavy metal sensor [Shumkonia mesophila]|uniref:periplasmic heavy metal sensor n=1 Tax=Shumkonia mesophila TaxID=2838854 RepID=UPI002934C19F|nr:periplasmic heavy metal sensor [Shumkonia mesophila]